jgi:1-acyl-sn-glycerol-3-phosphate acyltransferase
VDASSNEGTIALRSLGAYGVLSRISHAWMRWRGWAIEIVDPLPDKCVIIVYPHTSNWDFPVGLLTKWAAGLTVKRDQLRYAGKTSLFVWPWGWFFRAVGGFPVDRDGNSGFSEQMAGRFASASKMRLVIAPEGTRGYRDHVRSSFYYVAAAAKVPIILGTFDFAQKRVTITETFWPSGAIADDLPRIERYYQSIAPPTGLGHTPANAGRWRLR